MTDKLREAAQQALEALEKTGIEGTWELHEAAITTLRAALAEPVQEPVYWEVRCTAHPRWMRVDEQRFDEYVAYGWEGQRLYTAPPQRKPEPVQEPVASRLLTDDEIQAEWSLTPQNEKAEGLWFGRRIERLVRDIALAQQSKPLTDEEIDRLWRDPQQGYWDYRKFARAIEAKLKEKNT